MEDDTSVVREELLFPHLMGGNALRFENHCKTLQCFPTSQSFREHVSRPFEGGDPSKFGPSVLVNPSFESL